MIIVSACLAGVKCAYDGKARPCKKVIELVKRGKAIPVCPEQLGGLPTPRIAFEQKDGKVLRKDGLNFTKQFQNGAKEALRIAKLANCKKAILKARSPSCGKYEIYDGSFSGKLIKGNGIFVKLLKKNNIEIISDEEYNLL